MYQTPSVTNFTNKVNKTNGRPQSPQLQTARCQRQPKMEPVKGTLCCLGPQLASTPPHSELHHHLLPHHHIPPPDGPLSVTISSALLDDSGIVTLLPTVPPAPITTLHTSPAPSSHPSCPSHLHAVLGQTQPTLCHLN